MVEYLEWLDRFITMQHQHRARAIRNALNYSKWVTKYYDGTRFPDHRTDEERYRYADLWLRAQLPWLR